MRKISVVNIPLLTLFSIFSYAQQVEVQGKLKVTDISIDNNQEILLVKQSDGTFAGRELSSLPLPPPVDERSFSSDIELAKSLCECGGNIPPFLVASALEHGYSFEELYEAGVSIYKLLDAGITLQMFLDSGYTPGELMLQGFVPQDFYGLNYQGGLIFYLVYGGSGMVCAPMNQPSTIWGCEGTEISGADGEEIGSGYQNTMDILAGCTTPGTAAEICDQLILDGFDDWYLPSRYELEEMKTNLHLSGLGSFNTTFYWSSTEYSDIHARCLYFGAGGNNFQPKNDTKFLRAVRSFQGL